MVPSPTQANVQTALGNFLVAVLPSGVEVIAAQQNRVPEPKTKKFVVMTPIRFERLSTNSHDYVDAKFTGSIAGTAMTITHVFPDYEGTIKVGSTIYGVGVAANTKVTALGTGTGGAGTYTVSPTQTVASQILAAGSEAIEQSAKVTVQLDFHSDDSTAGDMAQTVSTLLRDQYGVQQFAEQDPNYGVFPLLADDPAQRPFFNDQQAYEWRWVIEAQLQVNQVVTVPMQFSEAAEVGLINVDERYPDA